MYMHSFCS